MLAEFKTAPLVDAYDVYHHLMDYWAETQQDDTYLISAVGWTEGVQPREIRQVKNKDGKLIWPEKEDFRRGKRRFKSDLVPATLIIDCYFPAERDAVSALEFELAAIEQQLDEKREEQGGEDGLLAEANEANEGEPPKITAKSVREALRRIADDSDEDDARKALKVYRDLLDKQAETKARLRALEDELQAKVDAKYPELTEDEIKALVVDDKWLGTLVAAVQGELDRVSQTLTGRIRLLAERYATPLPQLNEELDALTARVEGHLEKMGAEWN